jgi:hypothetical protein
VEGGDHWYALKAIGESDETRFVERVGGPRVTKHAGPRHQSATGRRAGPRRLRLGFGGAPYEHFIYDDAQLVNGTMADYLTPMAGEMPDMDVAHVQTHTSVSELGAKGVGESGTGAAPAVIMNAVNALEPFKARVMSQPITPP